MNQKYKDNQVNLINEYLEIDCICENKNYDSKNKIIKCFLCHKYQHLSCIFQAKFIKPYICFNCQFKNNHFYLKWKKTILPAKEIIYSNKWIKDKALLSKGTKKFTFFLNLNELYELNKEKNNKNDNNSHFLAFIWMTNNGKPFHFGFPDNISIKINNNEFYSTDNKGFKYPLLLSLDDSYDYSPKKKHLITQDNFEILSAADYFYPPKIINYKKKGSLQKVTISFDNPLENYYGSEFQYEEIRRYLFFIGVFQEVKIPQLSILKNSDKLKQYNDIFKYLYKEKVLKMKWNKISKNIISTDNVEEINMNFVSNISNQKIIHPIRGLFCQHSEVLDFGECCRYISSKNQIYKCYKCNKPLNVMYIDDISEKIFNEYKNKNYSEVYLNNKFKFIRGEKIDLNYNDILNENEEIENDENTSEDDYLNESFFKYHQKDFIKIKRLKSIKINNNLFDELTNIKSNDKNNESESDNVIEICETISLSSDSEINCSDNYLNIPYISQDTPKNNINNNNNSKCKKKQKQNNNVNFLIPKNSKNIQLTNKNNNNSFNKTDTDTNTNKNIENNNNKLSLKCISLNEKNSNKKKDKIANKLLQKKRKTPKRSLAKILIKNNKKNNSLLTAAETYMKNNIKTNNNKNKYSKINSLYNDNNEEIIEISQSSCNSNSYFLPINEENYNFNEMSSIQQFSTNSNDEKPDNNILYKDYNSFDKSKYKTKKEKIYK